MSNVVVRLQLTLQMSSVNLNLANVKYCWLCITTQEGENIFLDFQQQKYSKIKQHGIIESIFTVYLVSHFIVCKLNKYFRNITPRLLKSDNWNNVLFSAALIQNFYDSDFVWMVWTSCFWIGSPSRSSLLIC